MSNDRVSRKRLYSHYLTTALLGGVFLAMGIITIYHNPMEPGVYMFGVASPILFSWWFFWVFYPRKAEKRHIGYYEDYP